MQPLRPYEKLDTLRQFLDYDRQVLRFYCHWDDTDRCVCLSLCLHLIKMHPSSSACLVTHGRWSYTTSWQTTQLKSLKRYPLTLGVMLCQCSCAVPACLRILCPSASQV